MQLDADPEEPKFPHENHSVPTAGPLVPSGPPWSGWDVALIVFIFVLALLGASAVGIALAYQRGLPLDKLVTEARYVVPMQIFAYVATLVAMGLIARYSYHLHFWRAVEWNWPPAKLALAMLAAGAPLALILQEVQNQLPAPQSPPLEKFFRTPGDVYLMGILALAAAPLMEELFFRGLLYPVLRRWGVAIGVVLTAAVFALVHGSQYAWGWSAMLILFIVGLVLTTVRAGLRSVAAGFLLHFGYNLTLFVVLYFTSDHFRHLERAM
jgi:membrane protease YdiL (CAAX protease family)